MHFGKETASILSLLTLSLGVACADLDAPAPEATGVDDAELNLVAEAERANGNVLRLYEPMPGQILSVEIGDGLTLPRMDDAVALFRAAAPDQPVPEALVEAQEHARVLRLLANPADERDESGLSLPADQAVDAVADDGGPAARAGDPCAINTFIANECNDGDQEWCKIGWWNGFYAYNSSVNYMHNAVCSLTGTVTMKLIVNSELKASYTVQKGQIGKVAWIQNPIYLPFPPFFISNRFGFYTEVTNASGDQFHVGGAAGDK
jgi:hypothetical protein